MKRAFLEQIGGEWLDDFVYMSKQPLLERDFKVIPFDGDDMENTLLNKSLDMENDILIGSVEATVKFFEACNVEVPEYIGYPKELEEFYGRKIWSSNGYYLKSLNKPYFLKPSKSVKQFTGEVISSDSNLDFLREYNDLNDDTEVYVSDVIDIVSEYRCFIRDGELKGIQYYTGDFTTFPDTLVVSEMIRKYKSSNCCYTLDVGITDDGKTILVEINDMWAIGSYGFNSREYVLMCIRRMDEIYRNHERKISII